MNKDKTFLQGFLNIVAVVSAMNLKDEFIPETRMSVTKDGKVDDQCSTCDYKDLVTPDECLWCYMFKDKPEPVCRAHKPLRKK